MEKNRITQRHIDKFDGPWKKINEHSMKQEQEYDVSYSHHTLRTINSIELLKNAFNYTINNNTSIVAPYHNQAHIMNMCNTITEIYLIEQKITEKEYVLLLLAALFHDINHSQGKLSDDKNIEIALRYFEVFVNQLDMTIDSDDFDDVILLIKTTQYPYVIDAETESQKIIRDADLSQIFNYNSNFGHNVCGLKIELAKDMSWVEFMVNNNKFVENVNFETEYMKNKMINEKENLSEYLTLMQNIVNE